MGYEVVNPKTGNTGFEPISLGSEPSVLAVILIAYAATSAIPETARGFCLYTAQHPGSIGIEWRPLSGEQGWQDSNLRKKYSSQSAVS